MAGRFVRSSKYRHVFGRPTKKEQCYDNLRISKNAWDTNLVKANPKYLAVNWEASGGGAFAVVPLEEVGKAPDVIPLFRGHTAAVLDTDWQFLIRSRSPFNDSLIASGSDDGKVFIWQVPDNFSLHTEAEEPPDVSPVAKFIGHSRHSPRKVGHVLFNPSAENVLASASGDYTIKLWDVETGASKLQLKHNDVVQSLSWNASGSLLVTTSRDKKLRIWDVRQERAAQETQGHPGAKNSRAVWMGEHDRIATTGFSRMSDRQLGLWDSRAPREPINGFQMLDSISGVCMPFWDDGTQCLYLAGKGDGNIRYYEYQNDKFEYLSEYKSGDPQRGVAFMPKRGVNLHDNEVMRCFKTVSDSYVEPVSFIVPRRAEVFQEDVYPPTVGLKPAMSSAEWLNGKEGLPPKISLENVYDGSEPTEVPSTYKPPSAAPKENAPVKAEQSKPIVSPEPVATPAVQRGPPPSVKDNEKSIASMASKFADEEDGDSDDETSSFEEVPKPIERPATTRLDKTSGPTITKATREPVQDSRAVPIPAPVAQTAIESKPTTTAAGAAEGLRGALSDIKSMIEQQNRSIAALTGEVKSLSTEVTNLKARQSNQRSDGEKDERIRELELEIEELRS
ncbi:coronin-6 [Pseudovirgaria hyperparasitica]|uniref:Coronin n=1 Tax=Pseudovirgaria hyperparasitica TaxID=470096 RepID=A0A6A6WMA5_9PEZI|nr:coronin-6 [Pseudovirgaria hyperparasitica]KAF2763335.1 coronin-6 [Pseudovirgaria hyperparasitica]